MKPRLSILNLMAVIVFVAVGFAASRSHTELWASAIFTLTGFLLVVAVIKVCGRDGPRRNFWLGFAAFGWGHIFLLSCSPIGLMEPFPKLLTSSLLDALLHLLTMDFEGWNSFGALRNSPEHDEVLLQIGNSLLSLLIAFIGGIVTDRILCDDRPQP